MRIQALGPLALRYLGFGALCTLGAVVLWLAAHSAGEHPLLRDLAVASFSVVAVTAAARVVRARGDRRSSAAPAVRAGELRIPVECAQAAEALSSRRVSVELVVVSAPDARTGELSLRAASRQPLPSTYEVGSVTKVLTALLLAHLVTEGQLRLSDHLGRYVQPLPEHVSRLTIVDLATHTSGLPRLPPDLPLALRARSGWPNPYGGFSPERLLHSLRRTPAKARSASPTGGYSNFGYAVLGFVLSVVTGQDFETLMRQEIFSPLQLEHTGFDTGPDDEPSLAGGHDRRGFRVAPWRSPVFSPAGGVRTTPGDIGRLLHAFLEPERTALQRAVELTLEPVVLSELSTVGLGWQLKLSSSRRYIYWHNGSTSGSGASVAIYPAQGRGAAVLSNQRHRTEMDALTLELLMFGGHRR